MTTLTDLQQLVDEAWTYAHQARHYVRKARLRATLTTQEVQDASHRACMAVLWLSMPKANRLTLEITATVLTSHGLLDEKLPSRPPAGAPGDPPGRHGGQWARADDDTRFR